MAKSTTNTTGRTSTSSSSYSTNKQKNKQTSTSNNTQKGKSTSYKDLSSLTPQTLALQNKVLNSVYNPSQTVANAQTLKNNYEAAVQNLSPYSYTNENAMNELFNKIQNRGNFNYDFNTDALYKIYADTYAKNGQQAADNAAAAASNLTGGYANSYATTAAALANQEYMTELNNKIPELYQLAQERYNQETNDLYNKYGLYNSEDEKLYGRYQDNKNDLYTNRDYYNNNYNNERTFDYNQYQNQLSNDMSMMDYLTNLYAKDVTKSNSTSKSKDTSTNTTTNTSSSKDTSTSNSSNTSVTSSKGSSSKSSGTSNKTNYNDIKSTFKSMITAGDKKETEAEKQAAYKEAYDYLAQMSGAYISETEAEEIAKKAGAWNKRPTE